MHTAIHAMAVAQLVGYGCGITGMVFEYLYSAPQQPWANRGAFGSISSKKRDKF